MAVAEPHFDSRAFKIQAAAIHIFTCESPSNSWLPCMLVTFPFKCVSVSELKQECAMQEGSLDPGVPLCGQSAVHHQGSDTICFSEEALHLWNQRDFNIYECSNLP